MWKKIVDKLFCRHTWKSHAKNIYPSVMLNDNRNEQTRFNFENSSYCN